MFELAKTQFQLAVPLTGGKIHYPESDSVIRGHSPGRVFVDQSTAPQAALVWVQGQSGFFIGETRAGILTRRGAANRCGVGRLSEGSWGV